MIQDLEARLHDIHDIIYDPGNCLTPPRSILLKPISAPGAPKKHRLCTELKRKRRVDNAVKSKKLKESNAPVTLTVCNYIQELKKEIVAYNNEGRIRCGSKLEEMVDDCKVSLTRFCVMPYYEDDMIFRVKCEEDPTLIEENDVKENVGTQQIYMDAEALKTMNWGSGDRLYLHVRSDGYNDHNIDDVFARKSSDLCYMLTTHRELIKDGCDYIVNNYPIQHTDSGLKSSELFRHVNFGKSGLTFFTSRIESNMVLINETQKYSEPIIPCDKCGNDIHTVYFKFEEFNYCKRCNLRFHHASSAGQSVNRSE